MKREILGVVMCGGASARMGRDKASLEVRPGEEQLERQLRLLALYCGKLAASVGPSDRSQRVLPTGVEAILDVEGLGGPMAGIVAALRFARGIPVLALACDMPFLDASHLFQLVNRRDPEALATAFVACDGMPDPMCAIYEPRCLPELESLGGAGKSSLRRFLQDRRVERVEVENPQFLASVNDPRELEEARRRLGGLADSQEFSAKKGD
ncbi:molybdenum cofactor guanylyltransferase [Pelagicoccus sp. NFK12]|uniref:Molybdenum cofactor guanylyltransferase n=1 Tax=Pelagicoccus enzymogenes TaxID=2773457 RepID=A0A927FB21_9BACT|nr:molybdenum cofactor guanylyltransferase [Pelagicoccus enzymogenes]MBD5781687.1 molybdenum cofactor guanylyltransferase [Pelagicoccus enzymogenes]